VARAPRGTCRSSSSAANGIEKNSMLSDLKYALRMLVKAPAFTFIAILTLMLGIGANSAIFSVIDAVLLRPLPFPKPNELVAVWSQVARDKSEKETESVPNYVDLRDQSKTLQ